jgi:capsular exopolysaccharide synthesis family protein
MNGAHNQANLPGFPAKAGRPPVRNTISIGKLLAAVRRQRVVLGSIVVAALLIGVLVTLASPRTYSATASLQLNQQAPRVFAEGGIDPEPAVQDSARFLQTQLDRILSRSMAEAVAVSVRAAETPRILDSLGLVRGDKPLTAEDIVSAIQSRVSVDLGANTRIARIQFSSRDPEVTAQMANAYAETMAASNLVDKGATAAQAEEYLLTELAQAKSKLQESERAMLSYARNADISATVMVGKDAEGGSLRAQQLQVLNDQLGGATARRIEAEQQWRAVQSVPPAALPEVQDNRAIQQLLAQKAELDSTAAAAGDRYTDRYPGITEATNSSDMLDDRITQTAADIKRGYEVRYRGALRAEQQLSAKVSQLRSSAVAERERAVDYNSLQREVEANKAFYDGLLQRYQQIAAASGAPGENILVVDRATVPIAPSSPNIPRNLALSLVLGLIVAGGVGLVREQSRRVVRTADEAERVLAMPSLGMIPAVSRKKRIDEEMTNPRSAQSEAYYSAAVSLHHFAGGKPPKVALVVSCTPGEGKSTTSIGLARSYAAMRERVLLIDGDLRRPSLAAMLGARLTPGFAEVLAGTATIDAAVQTLDDQPFALMIAGEANGDPVGLLSSELMASTLSTVADQYDVVIIDGPPILGIADAILLADRADAAVFVVEAGRIESDQLRIARDRMPSKLPAGSILTKFVAKDAGVGYGTQGYYQY